VRAAAIHYSLVESCKANKVNPMAYLTSILSNARNKSIDLPTPDEFTGSNIAHVGRCALLQSGLSGSQDADFPMGSKNRIVAAWSNPEYGGACSIGCIPCYPTFRVMDLCLYSSWYF
jgi:hypothetical protein